MKTSIRKIKHGLFLVMIGIALCCPMSLHAQRSHGGQPYPQDIDQRAAITKSFNSYTIELPAFNVDSVLHEDSLYFNAHGPLHFAHKIPVNITPDNAGITLYTEDGTKVWKVGIRSSGAYTLNVIFEKFRIPKGAELFLYNPDRSQILGAFTQENMQESGEFPISPIEGDELIIEYHEPADAEEEGDLQILEINHDYRGLLRVGGKFQYLKMPCLPHLSCDTAYDTIGRSVCLLVINGDTYCTGVFVNNTQQDGKAYILTASHCLEHNTALGSRTVVFMNYSSPRCMSEIQGSEEFSLTGCTTKALSEEVDFALMELGETPPSDYRPYYAGWNRDSSASKASPFTCIHHPYGEGKRYAVEKDDILFATWSRLTDNIQAKNHWRVKKWETGHTWIGSSGSPLFDKNNHVIGTLTGGDSGGSNGCSAYTNGDYFSRIERGWDQFSNANKQLKCWLDPTNSGVYTLDGFDPWEENSSQRLSHIPQEDSIECIRLEDAKGYLFGHNQWKNASFAEEFETDSNMLLQGVYIMPAKGVKNSSYPIYVQILEGNETPGKILGETLVNPFYNDYHSGSFTQTTKTSYANKENYISFETPIDVSKHFYVACQIMYPSQGSVADTFALYASRQEKSTAWLLQDTWQTSATYTHMPISAALWIEPVVKINQNQTPSDDSIHTDLLLKWLYSKSNRILYVTLPDETFQYFDMEIFDLSGKSVFHKTSTLSPVYIPSSISSGIYIFTLRYGNATYRDKIIL